MDVVTLSMAKAYTDSQRLAYDDKTELVFDIAPQDREPDLIVADSIPLFWQSPVTPNKSDLSGAKFDNNSLPFNVMCDDTNILLGAYMAQENNELPVLVVLVAYNAGEFVAEVEGQKMTFTVPRVGLYTGQIAGFDSQEVSLSWETIHPIDPKFLPGVCLPVVELSTVITQGVSFTEEENKLLNAAWDKKTPVIIKGAIDIENFLVTPEFSSVYTRLITEGDTDVYTFFCSLGSHSLNIYSIPVDGLPATWGFNAT